MNYIDFHTHSTYSDGTYSPKELLQYSKKKNLKAIALTDHDTVNGINEALKYSKVYNIELVQGIEISSEYKNKEIHILGLFIKSDCELLLEELKALRERRKKRNIYMIEKLNNLGINITYEELKNISHNELITRAHFARLIVEKGYAKTNKDCFDKYLNDGKPAYVKKELFTLEKTLSLIISSGGKPILAHPLLYNYNQNELKELIKYLALNGLVGIECYYSTHNLDETNMLINTAYEFDLKISGGSDFHGDNKPEIDLGNGFGNLKIPYDLLEKLKEV